MKKILLVALSILALSATSASAQTLKNIGGGVLNSIGNKVVNKIEKKIDAKIDAAIDKAVDTAINKAWNRAFGSYMAKLDSANAASVAQTQKYMQATEIKQPVDKDGNFDYALLGFTEAEAAQLEAVAAKMERAQTDDEAMAIYNANQEIISRFYTALAEYYDKELVARDQRINEAVNNKTSAN